MGLLSRCMLAAAGLASTTIAALATYSPGPSYAVGIPSGSAISASSAGTIYMQLSAPTSYQWVGLGIGTEMAGASIFVMYADGNGNVTISARDGGQGDVEPQLDSGLMSGITLLEGSGIVGDTMVANVKCTGCTLLTAADSNSSPWICAWMTGNAIDSTDTSYTLAQHRPGNHRQFTFDLTAASLSADTNPFVSSAANPTSVSPTGAAAPTSSPGSDSGSSTTVGPSCAEVATYQKAHGIIFGVTVVLLFPLGAVLMRVVGGIWIHAAVQLFSVAALIAGFGLGVKLANLTDLLYKSEGKTHTIFGTVIFALFLIQPFGGLLHHMQYKKTGGRTIVSHAHIWSGRIIMICAVINGGLGLKLAANTKNGEIAYGVVAGVVALIYAAAVVLKRKGPGSAGSIGKVSSQNTEAMEETAVSK